jgi:hypothetical protein
MFALPARARWATVLVASVALAGSAAAQDSTAHPLPPVDIHGFVQVHYRTGDPLTTDGYKLRKADVKFSGLVTPRLHWRVAVDMAKALSLSTTTGRINDTATVTGVAVDEKSRVLQEAALTYAVNRLLSVDIGQQLLPLTEEGNLSLGGLETIERANFISEHSRGIGLGYVYDLGVSANGELPAGLEYHAGVFNEMGQSQGTTDANDQKSVVARLVYHVPMIPGLQFGGSGGWEPGPDAQRLQRLGPEAQYHSGPVTLRAEAMDGRDGALHRVGWYGLGAYRPVPRLQLAVRYDAWDRDESAESSIKNAFERQVVLGANYLVEGTSGKIAVNIIRQTFPNISSVPAATFALFAVQAAW